MISQWSKNGDGHVDCSLFTHFESVLLGTISELPIQDCLLREIMGHGEVHASHSSSLLCGRQSRPDKQQLNCNATLGAQVHPGHLTGGSR